LPEHLDRAEASARRPFDRAGIERRARDLGIVVREPRADTAARELLAHLRRGAGVDARLATLLREQLAALPSHPIAEELAEAAEWIGTSDLERGRALRDVLRLYDAIARSRDPVRVAPHERFPRFASRARRAVS
jgi:hypothetical protein